MWEWLLSVHHVGLRGWIHMHRLKSEHVFSLPEPSSQPYPVFQDRVSWRDLGFTHSLKLAGDQVQKIHLSLPLLFSQDPPVSASPPMPPGSTCLCPPPFPQDPPVSASSALGLQGVPCVTLPGLFTGVLGIDLMSSCL